MGMFYDPPSNFLKGSVTIPALSSSAVVTHGLGATPTLVWLQPQDANGVQWYITSLGATTFTVNIPAAQDVAVTLNYGVS